MKQLFTFLTLVFLYTNVFSQSYHTVTFSGNSSDFNAAEKYSAAANNTDYYVTYDASNLYIGAFRTSGSFGTDDQLTVYIDSDPNATPTSGTGSTTGQDFSGVTGTLPFSANYNAHVKASYEEMKNFASSWTTVVSGFSVSTTSTAREISIPFSIIGNPNALNITMWMGYDNGFFSNVPGSDISTSTNPTITDYFGGFGLSSADCIPTNTTNTPITDVITNTVPASGGLYGKVIVNTGTITATNNFNVAPGGSIEVTGGTLDISGRSINMGGSTIGDGKGSTINTTGSGVLTTNSSTTITFNGGGTLLGNALTSAATFSLNRKFTPLGSGAFTSTGIIQLNANSYINSNAITYNTGSTLKYNSGSTYGRGLEWSTTSGAGYPNNLQISNNTTINYPNGNLDADLGIAGDLTIDAGSNLYMDYGTGNAGGEIKVKGNLLINGNLSLGDGSGGDIYVGGNWERANSGSSFNNNGRAVFFTGTNNQIITRTGGGTESFAYLIIDKTGGSLKLNNSPATSIDITASSSDILQLNNTVGIDLNGQRLSITNAGGYIKLNSGNRNITSSIAGGLFLIMGPSITTVGISSPGTLTFGSNVTLGLSRGFDPTATSSVVTVNGILQINTGGILSNPLTYGSDATLIYTSTLLTTANAWLTGATVGVGVPKNVIINMSTTSSVLTTAGARTVPGNLTITNGELNADYALDILGNVSITNPGLLDGSDVIVTVSGNWDVNSTSAISGNGYKANSTGTVILNGTGSHTFAHAGGATFKNLTLSGTGSYTMNNDMSVATLVTISNGTFAFGTNRLYGGGDFTMSSGTLKMGKLSTILPELSNTFTITGGTIELNGAGTQTLRGGKAYINLTFSNSGTKTVSSAPSAIVGNLTLNDAAILDDGGNTIGNSSTTLIMNGTSKFLIAKSGTQPTAIGGTPSLGINTTIEYYGTVNLDIKRSVFSYANIVINGTNVNNNVAGIALVFQSGATFTVKNGATFKFKNSTGLSGGANTAISSTNSPTIILDDGSTIEYNGSIQTITNSDNYKNLTIGSAGTKTLAGDITVNGNLDLSAGTLDALTYTINLSGNILGTSTQINSSGKILMTGSAASISGVTLGNLELNNADGFSLSGSPTINGVLNLNTGKLTLGANNITLNSNSVGAITGHSASDYIVTNSTGLLRRAVTTSTTYDFPIGTSSNYEPGIITTGSTFTGPTRIDAQFINTTPTGPAPAVVYIGITPIATFLNYGYWNFTPDAALSAGSYDITLTSNGHTNADAYLDYHGILKGDNATNTWAAPGTHVGPPELTATSLTDPITCTATGVSSFSDYGIGKSNGFTLPIVLTEFTADLINTDVLLNWTTASEINNDYFAIERSMDGSIWNAIGEVNGAGSTSTINQYDFIDENAPGMVLYYRLKQIDFNGNYEYSDIRVVNNLGNESYIVNGYYNVTGQYFNTLENAPAGLYLMMSNKGNNKIMHFGN